jgi:CRISPR-associated endoribonuclease Cas6
MPSRWFLPLPNLDPSHVKLDHVHAAISRWFDADVADASESSRPAHDAKLKPYTISPPVQRRGVAGIEVAVLSQDAEDELLSTAITGPSIRVGQQALLVGDPRLVMEQTYAEMASPPFGNRWDVAFLTPTTFRSRGRSTPLPSVGAIMTGLLAQWNRWNDVGVSLGPIARDAMWVSDLQLMSEPLTITISSKTGKPSQLHLSAVTGSLVLRCDQPETAEVVSPLLRFASYCGVGSVRGRGLGVVQVREHSRSVQR